MRSDDAIENPLLGLARKLSVYDPFDLVSAAAALQLIPQNADRSIRLETLAHVAASLSAADGRPKIGKNKLAAVCNTSPLGDGGIAHAEDPFDNPFTEEIAFYDGSYVVFPGIIEEPTFILRHLAKAIFLTQRPFQNAEFVPASREILMAALTLSNEIARRLGFRRGVEPVSAPGGHVFVPDTRRLEDLKRTVTFAMPEIAGLLADKGVPVEVLDGLTAPLGSICLDAYSVKEPPLAATPLIGSGSRFVVGSPSLLGVAARHRIISLAGQFGVTEELAIRYCGAVWDTVVTVLEKTGHRKVNLLPRRFELPCAREGLFHLDNDKAMYVVLLTDPLGNYDQGEPFGHWRDDSLTSKVVRRVREIETCLFSLPTAPNELLSVILHQGVGRAHFAAIAREDEPRASWLSLMTAADLETVLLLEGGDPLAIWKHAVAANRIRETVKVQAFGFLDEYFYFRKSGHSYYLADDVRPNFISLMPGGAGDLRREVLRARDWHAAPSITPGSTVEVSSLHGTCEVPLYVPFQSIGKRVQLLVEGLPLPVWVIGPDYAEGNGRQKELHSFYAEFAETIGYWLWQLASSIERAMGTFRSPHTRIVVRLELSPDKPWASHSDCLQAPNEHTVIVSANPARCEINVRLDPSVLNLCSGPDNSGERELMSRVLGGIKGLLSRDDTPLLSDGAIEEALNRHAPLGLKKKLLILDSGANIELDAADLPRFRAVQEADTNEVLDEVGDFLQKEMNLHLGPIADVDRTGILKEVVDFCYRLLKRSVASHSAEGVLETLIAYNERIVQRSADQSLTLPTRLACFPSTDEIVKQLRGDTSKLSDAAAASRFLIEYVASQPPQGLRPISLASYDRLQAIASRIVNFGMVSDLIHFGLADIKVTVLQSGRLGLERDVFENAQAAYAATLAAGHVDYAREVFERHWKDPEPQTEKPEVIARLDQAAMVEFGHTVTEITQVMSEMVGIGRNANPVVACFDQRNIVDQLSDQLKLSGEKTRRLMELLSLVPRADYLVPPAHYDEQELYPWRFNRALSYARRPLLHRYQDGAIQVLWGPRHVHAAALYFLRLCLGGRLRATSGQMRQLMGEMNHEQGEAFNDEVADVLEQGGGWKVKRRVKKIKLASGSAYPFGSLGDIDVLAANLKTHVLYVIECKDLALARSPRELANELVTLFECRGGKTSTIEKHQRRLAWLHSHRDDLLTWLGLSPKARWGIDPLIVVSHDLFTPHLRNSPMRIMPLRELQAKVMSDDAFL
jgi:hypothetical protein